MRCITLPFLLAALAACAPSDAEPATGATPSTEVLLQDATPVPADVLSGTDLAAKSQAAAGDAASWGDTAEPPPVLGVQALEDDRLPLAAVEIGAGAEAAVPPPGAEGLFEVEIAGGPIVTEHHSISVEVVRKPASKADELKAELVRNLTAQAQHLTNTVHRQAINVSQKSDELSKEQDAYVTRSFSNDELEVRAAAAHQSAANASAAHKDFAARLVSAKALRDRLKTEMEEMQKKLAVLIPPFKKAEDEYQALLRLQPAVEGAANSTAARDRNLAKQLNDASAAKHEAKSVVEHESWELQQAIAELNRLNGELKAVQAKLAAKGAAARGTGSPAALAAAAVLLAVRVALL